MKNLNCVRGPNQLYLKIKGNRDVTIVFMLNLLIFTNTKEVFLQCVKNKQLINFRQKAINGFDVQNCPWVGQEQLAGSVWPSGRTLPRSVLDAMDYNPHKSQPGWLRDMHYESCSHKYFGG